MAIPVPLRLSQGHITLLETCPRKFQYAYLEQLSSPPDPEHQERMAAGSRFHLLMQQWQLGLPIDRLVQEDKQLGGWYEAFRRATPEIMASDASALRLSEHSRTLEFQGYLLTVVYDLVILTDRQASILDWKTYPRPQPPRWLARDWQTRLYPFVLAETSSYRPEQISLTYWFFQASDQGLAPQSLPFPYSQAHHHQIHQELGDLLQHLGEWLQQYQEQGQPFPQVPPGSRACEVCSYAGRCQRPGPEADPSPPPLLALADIEEIPL